MENASWMVVGKTQIHTTHRFCKMKVNRDFLYQATKWFEVLDKLPGLLRKEITSLEYDADEGRLLAKSGCDELAYVNHEAAATERENHKAFLALIGKLLDNESWD